MAQREAVIVGVADAPLENGMVPGGPSPLQIVARTAKQALADARLSFREVDGLLAAGLWAIPGAGTFTSAATAEYLGIRPRFTDSTNIGGSSFEAHVAHAAMAIERGYCEVALITYGSAQKSERSRTLGGRPPELLAQWETPWGLPQPVGGYAMAAMRHMHEHGTTREQLAEIAVAIRKWAQLNPAATMRDPLTVDEVLASPPICDPLGRLDCCLVTDGGGAIVMTTAEHARAIGAKAVQVRGFGEAHSHWTISSMPDLTRLTAAEMSGRSAMEMAGVTPDDFDVVEVYDSFTITVLLTIEALGFCKKGEGGAFFAGGRTAPGGDFPLNTNGGGLSCCHPGMYGMFPLIEAVRQLRGECGDRQVKGAKLALAHGTGGTLSSGATVVLARS